MSRVVARPLWAWFVIGDRSPPAAKQASLDADAALAAMLQQEELAAVVDGDPSSLAGGDSEGGDGGYDDDDFPAYVSDSDCEDVNGVPTALLISGGRGKPSAAADTPVLPLPGGRGSRSV